MRVALLGTGLLGSAMATRLAESGHQVTVWNRTPSRAASLAESGILVADSVSEAVANNDLILLVLGDAEAIDAVLFPLDDSPLLRGKALIQMGTIAPAESRAFAERAETAGARYLEAPVLGSIPEARQGTLIVMAGGDRRLFEDHLPLLRSLGANPRHIGPIGQAAALKLAMNQLIATLTAGFALSLGLVRSEGVDVELFMELLRQSALYAPTFDKKLGKYLQHDYSHPNFPLKHLLKDTALFARVANTHAMDGRLFDALLAIFEEGCSKGLADLDYSALYETINPVRVTNP